MELQTNIKLNSTETRRPSPWTVARRKFMKNKLAVISLVFLIFIVLIATFGPVINKQDIVRIDFMNMSKEPSVEHWLGTDNNGRDVFARMLYGGRTSLIIGFSCMLLISLIGTIIGCLSGFYGGKIDYILMRLTDFALVFPSLIFVIVINTIITGRFSGVWTLILVLSLLNWGGVARIIRSKVLVEKEKEYITAAIAIGLRPSRIIVKHILPNISSTIIVQSTLVLAVMIGAESGLSFLGFGVPANTPSWGNMLAEARDADVLRNKSWIWVPPATAISLTILSINFIGEGLKDALNPKRY